MTPFSGKESKKSPSQSDPIDDIGRFFGRLTGGALGTAVVLASSAMIYNAVSYVLEEKKPFYSASNKYFPDGLTEKSIIDNPNAYVQMNLENGTVQVCLGRAALYPDGNFRSAPSAKETTRLPADTMPRKDLDNLRLIFVPESEEENVSPMWYYTQHPDGSYVFMNELALINPGKLDCNQTIG